MNLEDVMRKNVVTASPSDSVCDVAGELNDVHVGSAIVVENGTPIGIVTDRDIAVRLCANWANSREFTVRDVMTSDLVTADLDTSILDLSRMMAEHSIRRIPIIENGSLVGIVAQDDIIVLVSEYLAEIAESVAAQAPPPGWGREY